MEYGPTTALIVVDVQNDFADPEGRLAVPGGVEVIEFINEQIDAASRAGSLVVYTQDWHPRSTPHFDVEGGKWPVHCVADTPGAELHPALDVIDGAVLVKKGIGGEDGYSAFNVSDPDTGDKTPTALANQLRNSDVEQVAILGLALDYCVKESALDARSAGFEATLLADGTHPVNLLAGDGARAVASLVKAGVTVE